LWKGGGFKVSIYTELKKANVPLGHHESDLYALVTPTSTKLITQVTGHTASVFRSEIDRRFWYDIPFSYDPYWENKLKRREGK